MACEQDGGIVWKKPSNTLTNDSAEDVWDDTALIKAYDKAVAQLKGDSLSASSDNKLNDEGKRKKKKKKGKKSNKKARTAYVKYDHYGNEEEVSVDQLLPVEKKIHMQTFEESMQYPSTENEKSNKKSSNLKRSAGWSISDICYAPSDVGYEQAVINSFIDSSNCIVTFVQNRKKKEVQLCMLQSKPNTWTQTGSHGQHNPYSSNFDSLPQFSGHQSSPHFPRGRYPDGSSFLGRSNTTMRVPPIPPPPMISAGIFGGDEEALANMLMSWYMSGYHTGYYQGMKANTQLHDAKNLNGSPFDSSIG